MRAAIGLCIAAAALGFAADAQAQAQQKVRWKMASSFAGTLDVVGEAGPYFSKVVDRVSGGTMEIKFYEPGALVPALQAFDPVSQGAIDAHWTSVGYYVGKIPASPIFTTVPFGPNFTEFMAWLKFGGGHELKDEIFGRYNTRAITCNAIVPEASGWFRKEIKTLDDLRGLKMRFFGLGAKVMEKFGVSTQLLAAGDVYPALELGTIDATELSFPSMDIKMGFHQVAKHYYFPGWHQQTTVLDLLVNLDKYKALSDQQKAIIDAACGETIVWGISASDARQFSAMEEAKAKGVELHRWPPEMLKAMKTAWDEVVETEAAKDADFKRTWESLKTFRASYAIWRDYGYLN
jgi:TRAP-type mannitol/chloroaromatic compound transport system substrate-binding protein